MSCTVALPHHCPRISTNHAELLILLGRKPEALKLLADVDEGIAARKPTYVERASRVAQLRALLAATEQRWDDVIRFAATSEPAPAKPPASGVAPPLQKKSFAGVLAEYALAKLGRSRTPVETIAQWPLQSPDLSERRDRAYWVGLTLLARGRPDLSETIVDHALSESGVRDNAEQGWRLTAVATLAARQSPSSATIAPQADRKNTTAAELERAWGTVEATAYFARPDLTALKNAIR